MREYNKKKRDELNEIKTKVVETITAATEVPTPQQKKQIQQTDTTKKPNTTDSGRLVLPTRHHADTDTRHHAHTHTQQRKLMQSCQESLSLSLYLNLLLSLSLSLSISLYLLGGWDGGGEGVYRMWAAAGPPGPGPASPRAMTARTPRGSPAPLLLPPPPPPRQRTKAAGWRGRRQSCRAGGRRRGRCRRGRAR